VRSGAAEEIVRALQATELTEIEDGALQIDLSKYGFEKKMVLRRGDGTSLYVTRDLAYHKWKASKCDRVIDILGADHKLISSQLQTVLRLMKVAVPEIVIFEFVSLPSGSMSTRKGKFITADDLLDEVEIQAFKEVATRRPEGSEEFKQSVAKEVALGAVRYDIVKVTPEKSTTFDWRSALDFEKLSAPFIQYSHARACSILSKSGEMTKFDPDLLKSQDEIGLIKKISEFDLVIERAALELKPHLLATYARELAESFNQFYRYSPVLDAEPEVRAARLGLVNGARNALKVTLETLGITPLESM
jgi:arginyl-tRNA synthetase